MKIGQRLMSVLFGLCAFILLLYAALIPNAMNRQFYADQFVINQSFEEANVSEEQLNDVIDHVLHYLWDEEENMQLTITYADDTTGLAFSERELAHMVDVKNLFLSGRNITLGCGIIATILLGLFVALRNKLSPNFTNTIRNTLFGILGFFALVGIYALLDFNHAFTIFHEIFFTNDLWLLNYDDLLIQMLPESLFATIAFQTLLHFFTYLILLLLILRQIKKRMLQQHP